MPFLYVSIQAPPPLLVGSRIYQMYPLQRGETPQKRSPGCSGRRPKMPKVTLLVYEYYLELGLITIIDIYLPTLGVQ